MYLISDSAKIDSLSVIPQSVVITDSLNNIIDTTKYFLNYSKSVVYFKNINHQKINIKYKVFPYNFDYTFKHKEIKAFEPIDNGYSNKSIFYTTDESVSLTTFQGLNKRGSISRGISFGNNQDVVVNSNLNLQLSGKLSDDVEIMAAISDNNIPIQPDGNTQQIQEFDKVFIKVYNDNNQLIMGDFELLKPESYFMNFSKKAQGADFSNKFNFQTKSKEKFSVNSKISASFSKGKYVRKTINQTEGNQGPYKLSGINNENYIVVLSGSEKIYIDGKLLKRGQEYDYIIDYNMGEITFTSNVLITKDKRITAEYEYSDKNYARSMFFAGSELENKKFKIKINMFSEQDLKNQPLQMSLNESQKARLASIGDNIQKAYIPYISKVSYDNNLILYKKIDTTIAFVKYDSVFVYSTSPDSAIYKLGFTYVGKGNGNYIQIPSNANGKVFKWISPVNNTKQGDYEPIILMITPKQKQMFTLGSEYNIDKNTVSSVEFAVSTNDLNTFSTINDNNNNGFAFVAGLKNTKKINDNNLFLNSDIKNEFVDNKFSYIERYRDIEFNRDWNIISDSSSINENLSSLKLDLSKNKVKILGYNFGSFVKGNEYQGFRNSGYTDFLKKGFSLKLNASYLYSKTKIYNTNYLKHKIILSKSIKSIVLGIRNEQENNKFKVIKNDSLMTASFMFKEYEGFMKSNDSVTNNFMVNYIKRYDYLPLMNSFQKATMSDNAGLLFSFNKNPDNIVTLSSSYRKLSIYNSALTNTKPDEIILGRIEHFINLFSQSVTANTFFEIGSGMEVKKEFSYLWVGDGQGVYVWKDYNSNNVKELNEFEVAVFKNEANYIRIFIPTNEYIKNYSTQFSEVINLSPANFIEKSSKAKDILSKINNQSAYRVERKSTEKDFFKAYNPFLTNINEISLITLNSSFRNMLSLNRIFSKLGFDFIYQDNSLKQLLINGFDSKKNIIKSIKSRYNITREIALNISYTNGLKLSSSEYFKDRDYKIKSDEIEPSISFQPNNSLRITLSDKYSFKKEILFVPSKVAKINDLSIEINSNTLKKGYFLAKLDFIKVDYNYETNSAIAFEMLESLAKGNNWTWNLSYQRDLSEFLQMNISYDGRKSQSNKVIHIGSVQLRAFF